MGDQSKDFGTVLQTDLTRRLVRCLRCKLKLFENGVNDIFDKKVLKQGFHLISVIITPAPASGGYIVNGITQTVVLPNTSTTVQVTSPRAGSVLTPSASMVSPMSSPVRPSSSPTTPKMKGTTPTKPRKTGSLALFFRKVHVQLMYSDFLSN